VRCYRHQQGSLTISVRQLRDVQLPGEQDGNIWMWHRCLRCDMMDNFPPATRRVLMSRAAWGLSFGKFLELTFSNHTTANRVAPCGHSLPRDCLRFYGYVVCFCFVNKCLVIYIYACIICTKVLFSLLCICRFGSMVALFQYSPIDILSVSLPLLILDSTGDVPRECIRREAKVVFLFLVKICCHYFHKKYL
jgi:1-phosphatidylinositol-3-phosphate 5-kinase